MPATACSTSLLSANSFDRPEPSRFSLPINPSRPVLATFSRNTSLSPLAMTVSLGLASLRPILPAFSLAFFIWPSSVFFSSAFFFSARWCEATFSCSIGASSFTSCAGVSASVLGGSLLHINVSSVANRPRMIVAAVTVRRSSGSSWRGRADGLGLVDEAQLHAQVARVGQVDARAIAGADRHLAQRAGAAALGRAGEQIGHRDRLARLLDVAGHAGRQLHDVGAALRARQRELVLAVDHAAWSASRASTGRRSRGARGARARSAGSGCARPSRPASPPVR